MLKADIEKLRETLQTEHDQAVVILQQAHNNVQRALGGLAVIEHMLKAEAEPDAKPAEPEPQASS